MARLAHVSHLRDWILHQASLTYIEALGAPFIVVSGSHAQRMATATAAVDALVVGAARRHARVPAWLTISRASWRSSRAAGEATG